MPKASHFEEFHVFAILQECNHTIKIYYFMVIIKVKDKFDDNSQNNNYGEETDSVNYESIINEFAAKKKHNN